MRFSVKVAFVLFSALVVFQIYINYGRLTFSTKNKVAQSAGTPVKLRTRGEAFVFTIPATETGSIFKSEARKGQPPMTSPPKDSHTLLPPTMPDTGPVPETTASLTPSSSTREGDNNNDNNNININNNNNNSNETRESALEGARITSALQSFFQNLSSSDLRQIMTKYFPVVIPALHQQRNGTEADSQGVIVQQGSKLLLSSAPGKVKLPEVRTSAVVGQQLPPCPDKPPSLVGYRRPDVTAQKREDLEKRFLFLGPGGDYRPRECRPRQRVALVIPYRNRWGHLLVLLHNLIPFLVRQQVSFSIFVIEQEPPSTFNRALLLNVGILEASLRDLYDCFILHDVDLIPLHDSNLYRCSQQPKHFAVGINKFKYALPYADYFGGVTGMSREQVEKINGNSNLYFGWGGEDDELLHRVTARGMKVVRYPPQISRYDMFRHGRDHGNEANPIRFELLKSTSKRMDVDGLNSLQYNVTSAEVKPLFTWIKVAVDPKTYVQTAPAYVKGLLVKLLKLK